MKTADKDRTRTDNRTAGPFAFHGAASGKKGTMNTSTLISTLTVKATLAELIPGVYSVAERIAWIEKFGPVCDKSETAVRFTAPASEWASIGLLIREDGSVGGNGSSSTRGVNDAPAHADQIRDFLAARVLSDGRLMDEYDGAEIIEAVKRHEEIKRRNAAEADAEAERRRKEHEDRQAADKAAKAAAQAEIAAWITAHGSERLRRCLAEGIPCGAAYLDERIALERNGWRWQADVRGDGKEPRNPPAEAFALLDEARKTEPTARLTFWTAEAETDDETGEETKPAWRGYAAEAEFLGNWMVFGGPQD